jgi:hypothetical protein
VAAQLELVYRLEERIPLDVGASSRPVERWVVSVLLDGAVEIGYAHILVFRLEPGRDIGELADTASGTWIEAETRAEGTERAGHVLLLDRIWLEPDHRGEDLGAIVAAAAIGRLARGCHLAACYPAPFEADSGRPEDEARAVEALGRVWSKVGFRHWRDGVWMLDLTSHDMDATLAKLVAARAQRVDPVAE